LINANDQRSSHHQKFPSALRISGYYKIKPVFSRPESMSPQLEAVLQSIAQLSSPEKLEVIRYIAEQLKQQTELETPVKRTWRELRGIAPNILRGQDAQTWVTQQRNEWSDRETVLNRFNAHET